MTIVETGDVLGQGMIDALLGHLLIWFGKKGVASITGVSSVEITKNGVTVVTKDGKKQNHRG